MEQAKKYLAGWVLWGVGVLILGSLVVFTLNAVGLFGKTVLERKVFEQSYQKQESDKTARTVLDAELAQLRGRLGNPNLDAGTRAEIQAQIDAIMALKSTKED